MMLGTSMLNCYLTAWKKMGSLISSAKLCKFGEKSRCVETVVEHTLFYIYWNILGAGEMTWQLSTFAVRLAGSSPRKASYLCHRCWGLCPAFMWVQGKASSRFQETLCLRGTRWKVTEVDTWCLLYIHTTTLSIHMIQFLMSTGEKVRTRRTSSSPLK